MHRSAVLIYILLALIGCSTFSTSSPSPTHRESLLSLHPSKREEAKEERNLNDPRPLPFLRGGEKRREAAKSTQVPKVTFKVVKEQPEEGLEHPPGETKKKGKRGIPLKGRFELSLENMPLGKFVHFIFGKVLKLNYFVDRTVENRKETVSLRMAQPLEAADLFKVVKEILKNYNVTVEEREGVLFIRPAVTRFGGRGVRPLAKKSTRIFVGRTLPEVIKGEELITQVVPLFYIKASDQLPLIKSHALSPQGMISVPAKMNALIVTDKASNVRIALQVIEALDRPSLVDKEIRLIPIEFISPDDFKERMEEVLPHQGVPVAKKVDEPGVFLIPIPEISSILCVSSKKEWLEIIEFWRKKLDDPSVLGDQPRIFIYHPRNRRAQDLMKVISDLIAVQPPSTKEKGKGEKSKKGSKSIPSTASFRVTLDESLNALVILATPSVYKEVREVLERLDVLPRQVLVEVTIAEVTLTDQLAYGVEWYIRQHYGEDWEGILQTLEGLGIGGSGLNYYLIGKNFEALLNLFAQKNLVNILSRPRIVVLDNESATINVGTDIPVVTSESTTPEIQQEGTSSLVRTIQYRSTGVILTIKPTINSEGVLTVEISQEVSEAQQNTLSPDISSPIIMKRSIQTKVVLKSGESILLGGLISENVSRNVNKVPVLGDIPLMGHLFKTTSKGKTKTELIVQITPRILSTVEEAVEVTQGFKRVIRVLEGGNMSQ